MKKGAAAVNKGRGGGRRKQDDLLAYQKAAPNCQMKIGSDHTVDFWGETWTK